MRYPPLMLSAAMALAMMSGCDRGPRQSSSNQAQTTEKPAVQMGVPTADATTIEKLKAAQPEAGMPFFDLTFDEARIKAHAEDKVVMVDFYTAWCVPCKTLDKQTWPDPGVRKWLERRCISLEIDAVKEAALAKHYHVKAYPTMIFVRPDGALLGSVVGFHDPAGFREKAAAAIAGIAWSERLKEELERGEANDPMRRHELADVLTQEGKHAEALEHYLWCFDHGLEHDAAYVGVHGSFLVGGIVRLGRSYPPALDALRARRDQAAAAVLAGTGTWQDASNLAAINRELGEDERTLAVYDQLKQSDAENAQVARPRLFRDIVGLLLADRRYEDIAGGPQGADRTVALLIRLCHETEREYRDIESSPASFMRQRVIHDGGQFYEALLGVQKAEDAARLAARLIEFDPTGRTVAVLIAHAVRAGDNATARALADRSLKELPESERVLVEDAALDIPE